VIPFKLDVASSSLSKHHEEVCGDTHCVIHSPEGTTIILSDGLGSGIKASILSILTTRIAAGLLKRKVSLEQVFETIAETLPICKTRQLAYSTLSILHISQSGAAHLIEYDNPELMLIRDGGVYPLERHQRMIASKLTQESFFQVQIGDILLMMSDGAVNAGVGGIYRLGLGNKGIAEYFSKYRLWSHPVMEITHQLLNLVDACYLCEPGDDATVIAVSVREPRKAVVFTGPPLSAADDRTVCHRFMREKAAVRVVCGGATGNLIARELNKPIKTSLVYEDPSVPPTASIEGIDLVTEGILTLNKCLERLNAVAHGGKLTSGQDGATLLAQKLLDADEILFLTGAAINPAHEQFMQSLQLLTRSEVVMAISQVLTGLGKEVTIETC